MGSLLDRLLAATITLVAIALLLRLAWVLVRPVLIPVGALGGLVLIVVVLQRWRSYW
jgi:hypothetical protein